DGAQNAVLLPLACGRGDLGTTAPGTADTTGATGKLHVLHQRNRRKPTQLLKEFPAHEKHLITSGNASEARSQIHHETDDAEHRMFAIEAHIEASPLTTTLQKCLHLLSNINRQAGISMEEH